MIIQDYIRYYTDRSGLPAPTCEELYLALCRTVDKAGVETTLDLGTQTDTTISLIGSLIDRAVKTEYAKIAPSTLDPAKVAPLLDKKLKAISEVSFIRNPDGTLMTGGGVGKDLDAQESVRNAEVKAKILIEYQRQLEAKYKIPAHIIRKLAQMTAIATGKYFEPITERRRKIMRLHVEATRIQNKIDRLESKQVDNQRDKPTTD